MGGTCANTESGAAGADKICQDKASNAELPSGFSYTHRAMLHRGGTGDSAHPRNLDIPNKEREIRRVDDTTVIASHYDMDGADNDYWDSSQSGYSIANGVPARTDSTDSTINILYAWSGLRSNGDLAADGFNCNDWEDGSGSSTERGTGGQASATSVDRHVSPPPYTCDTLATGASLTDGVGLLCASY